MSPRLDLIAPPFRPSNFKPAVLVHNHTAADTMAQTLVQLHAPANVRGRVIGLYSMASLGLRAFSGITVGIMGGLIGVHWSLALSALALLAVIIGLLAFAMRPARTGTE